MHSYKRHIMLIAILIIAVFSFTACTASRSIEANSFSKDLKIHYIDVGQGDSILIQSKNKNLLIDAGTNSSQDKLLSYLQKQGIKKLDYVVATHPHEDHIGGMEEVIKKFSIGSFYAPKVTATTKTYENMISALKSKNLKINIAKAGVTFNLTDKVKCEMLAPVSGKYDDLNNYSAVIRITYGENSFLFMGDAEKLSEKEILDSNAFLKSDVLKVGHHGSVSSSSKEFLDKVSPKIAVISCGKNNDYGHPHKETLDEFKKRKYTVYRTDQDGTIILISDGKNINKK